MNFIESLLTQPSNFEEFKETLKQNKLRTKFTLLILIKLNFPYVMLIIFNLFILSISILENFEDFYHLRVESWMHFSVLFIFSQIVIWSTYIFNLAYEREKKLIEKFCIKHKIQNLEYLEYKPKKSNVKNRGKNKKKYKKVEKNNSKELINFKLSIQTMLIVVICAFIIEINYSIQKSKYIDNLFQTQQNFCYDYINMNAIHHKGIYSADIELKVRQKDISLYIEERNKSDKYKLITKKIIQDYNLERDFFKHDDEYFYENETSINYLLDKNKLPC